MTYHLSSAGDPGVGGQLLLPPMDAGSFRRYATVMDPQGGCVSLFRSDYGNSAETDEEAE